MSAPGDRARPAIQRERQGVFTQGSYFDGELSVAAAGALVAFAVESVALPLYQSQTSSAFGPIAFDSHAGGFRIIQRAVLSSGLLAADPVLCFGHLRNPESVHQKV